MTKLSNSKLHNLNLVLDEEHYRLSSSNDEDDENTVTTDSPELAKNKINSSELIKETNALLKRRSSTLSLEEETPTSTMVSSSLTSCPTSILGTKHVKHALPVLQDLKPKKSVRFGMENNVTFEIQQPEFRSSIDSTDSESFDIECDQSIFGNIRDASSLLEDSDDDEDDDEEEDQDVNNNHPIEKDIKNLEKQKQKLIRENEELRNRHEREMKQLREEYQRRREDYYDELDEVQHEMDERRNKMNTGVGDHQDYENLKQKQDLYLKEKNDLEEKEKQIKKKKDDIAEQEKELQEYQQYLNRRHKSLNEKEEDLCILQDELEDLSDALSEKRAKLKEEEATLIMAPKGCNHDDEEIEQTRIELMDSLTKEKELRKQIAGRDKEIEKQNTEIKDLELEKNKLRTKIKHLESQLSLIVKPVHSHYHKRTSLRHMTGIPLNVTTGENISPPSTSSESIQGNKRDGMLSPTRDSPKKTLSSPPHVSNTSSLTIKNEISEGSPNHLYVSRNKTNVEDLELTDDSAGEPYYFEESEDMYSKDTTDKTKSSKSAISKTCLIM
ncbi:interaptin-like [Hydractinia symbiolongicarpus]|uniref:interaptin-like n=1 Tax=Hydractinia symbiolongicarpus TaxID=13093 RepID=UPI00254DFDA6|nr:interaptin-like [Hydractinia symbiolongicarpus]